jgi:hypothetical protein
VHTECGNTSGKEAMLQRDTFFPRLKYVSTHKLKDRFEYSDALADFAPMAGLFFSIVRVDMFSIPAKDCSHIGSGLPFWQIFGSLFIKNRLTLTLWLKVTYQSVHVTHIFGLSICHINPNRIIFIVTVIRFEERWVFRFAILDCWILITGTGGGGSKIVAAVSVDIVIIHQCQLQPCEGYGVQSLQ